MIEAYNHPTYFSGFLPLLAPIDDWVDMNPLLALLDMGRSMIPCFLDKECKPDVIFGREGILSRLLCCLRAGELFTVFLFFNRSAMKGFQAFLLAFLDGLEVMNSFGSWQWMKYIARSIMVSPIWCLPVILPNVRLWRESFAEVHCGYRFSGGKLYSSLVSSIEGFYSLHSFGLILNATRHPTSCSSTW